MHLQPSDKPVPNATLQVTGAVGWRREGLVYKKNEVLKLYICELLFLFDPILSTFVHLLVALSSLFQVFLDIVESVNLLMSSKGTVWANLILDCTVVFPYCIN